MERSSELLFRRVAAKLDPKARDFMTGLIDTVVELGYSEFLLAGDIIDEAASAGYYEDALAASLTPEFTTEYAGDERTAAAEANNILGRAAARNGEFADARYFLGVAKANGSSIDIEGCILSRMTDKSDFDRAEKLFSEVGYDFATASRDRTEALAELVWHYSDISVDKASKIFDKYVEDFEPDRYDEDMPGFIASENIRYMHSKYDYIMQPIIVNALHQKKFDIADKYMSKLGDWFISAAMGGGGVLDNAYATGDENIKAATMALIKKHFHNGPFDSRVDYSKLDNEYLEQIKAWLVDS